MKTMFPTNFLMADAECDRAMEGYFRERAEEMAAEREVRRFDDVSSDAGDAAAIADPVDGTEDMEIPPDLTEMMDVMERGEPVLAIDVSKPGLAAAECAPAAHSPTATSGLDEALGSRARDGADLSAFPVASVTGCPFSEDPLRDLTALCRQIIENKDYPRVRADYCRLSVQLNELGKLAPGYRPAIKTGAGRGAAVHMILLRDQIVIDLHWCFARQLAISASDSAHQALFDQRRRFHFDLAWAISGKSWTREYRAAEVLCLTTLQQCQLLQLRGPEVAERAKALQMGWRESKGKSVSRIATARRQIGQWAERDKRIFAQRGYYEQLWLARELLGPGCSSAQIAELHALMVGGDVQDRATIRDKLKSLDKQLARA